MVEMDFNRSSSQEEEVLELAMSNLPKAEEPEVPEENIDSDPILREALEAIPDKMAFKIGEVADIVGVKPYVLRFWETEFDVLRPKKSGNGQRMYTRKDVEMALRIKKLLYLDRFSIEGARIALKRKKKEIKADKQWDQVAQKYGRAVDQLEDLVEDIRVLKNLFV